MFKIINLELCSVDDSKFIYEFKPGINYFKGKNSSGKTEFYSFIDFMFGSSEDIRKKPWYNGTLAKATMQFEYNGLNFKISRTSNPNINYLYYSDEEETAFIDLREYKGRLNKIFARDIDLLKDLKNFTEEELTYRSFTMFNFLGEKRQGAIHDFFDKCSDVKYSVKLAPILNFIFNKHLERIYELQKELNSLLSEVRELETATARYDFIFAQINKNLQKLGTGIWYSGKNAEDIKIKLNEIKNMNDLVLSKKEKNIADLEVMYSNISEQIKIYENRISDYKQIERDNQNRKLLLEKLNSLLGENSDFEYLVSPLQKLISELDSTISFSKFLIGDSTINELKKQREQVKMEIKRNDSRFRLFSMEEKAKAIIIIEDYLSADIRSYEDELKQKKKRIKEIREELRVLQNSDDNKKIEELSKFITDLYQSAKDISSVVDDDFNQEGFKIQYLKKGNILQPTIIKTEFDENELKEKKAVNYYIGSMARHTLIQLCGYFGFLKILIEENKYPIIPILVIDHLSKPFDHSNSKAIGRVISKAYESIGKNKLQLFMFDDEEYETLDLKPDHSENLVTEFKTGFNPFFTSKMNGDAEGDQT
ncbi:hypothetical protein NLX78_15800 [Paenibacillus sp. Lou8.1]|uniref:hypothetical protein n=1 Tax=Paenibacillus sp. Lou8.1 TaxID=2962041 RepID=UPI0020B79770|nr:hypothetical protein [Paenibacillus sp. Lou8.1]MCP3808701.1 hypothetical protein [Paenibacillus sp. Lou8.1]